MSAVTLWYRFDEEAKEWDYNHYEEGHVDFNSPTPFTANQIKPWAKAKWKKVFRHIQNGIIQPL